LAVNQTDKTLSETGSPQDEIDPETIREWKTLRRNLAFANAALSIGNAEQFVDSDRRSTDDSVPCLSNAGFSSPSRSPYSSGATDRPALLTIRDVVEGMEPLATAELDDYLHPSVLEVCA